jgi:TPR repeat protein
MRFFILSSTADLRRAEGAFASLEPCRFGGSEGRRVRRDCMVQSCAPATMDHSRPNSFYGPEFGDTRRARPASPADADDVPLGLLDTDHTLRPSRAPSPPQPGGPLLDHSHLRPGNQASLLSHDRTLELYRANAKKTQDPDLQFEFAVFMIDASKTYPIPEPTPGNVMDIEKAVEKRDNLVTEALALLKRLADRGHPASQYFLADCYANGIGTYKGKQDFDRAYPLFVLAAKHGHPDAAYRAGTCCENGWGCRRESPKALQFFRKAAAALHPGAMYRLGIVELNGELGLAKRPREGVKWLKRSAEHATAEFPHALHELSLLHENGIYNVVFVDTEYAIELLAQASELGYAPSAYRLGEFYEYGKLGCPQDPALSIHYYVRPGHPSVSCTDTAPRTLLRSRTIVMRALLSRRGISSVRQGSFRNRTPKPICGQRRLRTPALPRRCMPWAISSRSESAPRQIPKSTCSSRRCPNSCTWCPDPHPTTRSRLNSVTSVRSSGSRAVPPQAARRPSSCVRTAQTERMLQARIVSSCEVATFLALPTDTGRVLF